MKTAEEILAYITRMIGYIYHRPRMYGGTAEGVHLLLANYHQL